MSQYRSPKIPRARGTVSRSGLGPGERTPQEDTKIVQARVAQQQQPLVVCMFGPPRAGVSSICRLLRAVSRTAVVLVPDFGELTAQVDTLMSVSHGPTHLLIDGVPMSAEALQGIWDLRLATPPNMIVEVFATYETCAARGAARAAYDQYMQERVEIEKHAAALGATLHSVMSDADLATVTERVCTKTGIED